MFPPTVSGARRTFRRGGISEHLERWDADINAVWAQPRRLECADRRRQLEQRAISDARKKRCGCRSLAELTGMPMDADI